MEVADLSWVRQLCVRYPGVKFLLTVLSNDNQHELCVLARKFGNLHVYGCWWFCVGRAPPPHGPLRRAMPDGRLRLVAAAEQPVDHRGDDAHAPRDARHSIHLPALGRPRA